MIVLSVLALIFVALVVAVIREATPITDKEFKEMEIDLHMRHLDRWNP